MSKKEKFVLNINLVILAADIRLNKQYVLSIDKTNIEIPRFVLEKNHLTNIEEAIVNHAQSLVFTNELELTPQLISLHNLDIGNSINNELNTIYGFVIKKTDHINEEKCFWIEFDYINPNKYSNLLFEVTQKLK